MSLLRLIVAEMRQEVAVIFFSAFFLGHELSILSVIFLGCILVLLDVFLRFLAIWMLVVLFVGWSHDLLRLNCLHGQIVVLALLLVEMRAGDVGYTVVL